MELGAPVGLRLPSDARIWAVEAGDVCTFSENLTEDVQRAVPLVVAGVVRDLVSYARSWRRGKTFGAERFERELAEQRPAACRSKAQRRFLDFLDGLCAP